MPQSLVKLLVHVVFSTKNRTALITPASESALYGYVSGIIANNESRLILANGTADHVHLLISLGRTVDISTLVGDIKRGSSKWVKESGGSQNFYWQEGYGAFSIGQSQVQPVISYIQNQKVHHGQQDFQEEFRTLLTKYELEFDERYVWD